MAKFTAKQKIFCEEYLVDLNATKAAMRAGYGKKNAKQQGTENLAKPAINERIALLMQERSQKTSVDSEYVLNRLKEIDELDILDIMSEDLGSFKALSDWPKSWRTSISGIDMQTVISGGEESAEKLIKKIKWPDKTKNLELIGKHVNVKAFDADSKQAEQPPIEINIINPHGDNKSN